MKGFIDDIEDLADANEAFRRVVYTGRNLQLVLMRLLAGEEIAPLTPLGNDQFFHFVDGEGAVVIDGVRARVKEDSIVLVPAGARHSVANTGPGPLAFYSLYGSPELLDGLVQHTLVAAAQSSARFDGVRTE